MKTPESRFRSKLTTVILILCVLPVAWTFGQSGTGKSFEVIREFDINEDALVKIASRNGNVIIETWEHNKVEFVGTMTVKARDDEDIQRVFDAFNEMKLEGSKSVVNINTRFYNSSQGSFGRNIKLKLLNGSKAEVKDFNVKIVLTVPKTVRLAVETKYQDVLIPDMEGEAKIHVYDGDLIAGDFSKQLFLKLRYATARLRSTGTLKAELYDSDVEMEDIQGDLDLSSKYSSLNGGVAGSIHLDSYDDDIVLGDVGSVSGNCRYSHITLGNTGDIDMEVYDSHLKTGDSEDIYLISKYSQYRIISADEVTLHQSYDDMFNIQSLSLLKCESKYSEYWLGKVSSRIRAISYDDTFEVDLMGRDFKEVDIKAKYTDISLTFPEDTYYTLDASMVYPTFHYPEELIETNYNHKDGSDWILKGAVKNAPGEISSQLLFDTYDCQIKLKHH